jgi:hypothetical protein
MVPYATNSYFYVTSWVLLVLYSALFLLLLCRQFVSSGTMQIKTRSALFWTAISSASHVALSTYVIISIRNSGSFNEHSFMFSSFDSWAAAGVIWMSVYATSLVNTANCTTLHLQGTALISDTSSVFSTLGDFAAAVGSFMVMVASVSCPLTALFQKLLSAADCLHPRLVICQWNELFGESCLTLGNTLPNVYNDDVRGRTQRNKVWSVWS